LDSFGPYGPEGRLGRITMNLAALLFDVARRQPEAPAISDGVHAWNYREFARRISCLAGGLAAHRLEPGDRVMLCMENCAEFLELLFACWAAGLCAVPVNARLHVREVEHIASDSSARLLVATPNLAEGLAPLARSVETLVADHLDPQRRVHGPSDPGRADA
jgi:long-chain acyl-CoA synthetase